MGFSDTKILLMNANNILCDDRNPNCNSIYNTPVVKSDISIGNIEIDYDGLDVTPESFLALLYRKHAWTDPESIKLLSDKNSNVFIYLTGHGGNEFFKFHDKFELSAQELGAAVHDMDKYKRYKNLLIIIDTCQAFTMFNYINSSNVIAIASSKMGENSYAYAPHEHLQLPVIDRFSYLFHQFFENNLFTSARYKPGETALPLRDLWDHLDPNFMFSNPALLSTYEGSNPKDINMLSFMADPSGEPDVIAFESWRRTDRVAVGDTDASTGIPTAPSFDFNDMRRSARKSYEDELGRRFYVTKLLLDTFESSQPNSFTYEIQLLLLFFVFAFLTFRKVIFFR